MALVDGVVPYYRWQSNTVWLKDPPKEYAEKVQPAVDIWGELKKIRDKVVGNQYKNEYEVGATFRQMHVISSSVLVRLRALQTNSDHS